VSGITDRMLIRDLLGIAAHEQVEEAIRLGLVTSSGAQSIGIHPLLAEFLVQRSQQSISDLLDDFRALIDRLLARRRWDECLQIAESVPDVDLPISQILESALEDFLGTGRLATLTRWVELARARRTPTLIVDLPDGEIALRAGDYERALALGSRVAGASLDTLTTRACLLAARAAHLGDKRNIARCWFERAEVETSSDDLRAAAIYGQFLVGYEEESPNLRESLTRLERTANGSEAHDLRVSQGRLLYGLATRDVDRALDASRSAQALVSLPVEPLARLSSMNLHAWTLIYAGRYADALAAAERSRIEAREFGIDFAVLHAQLSTANALIGLRRFASGARILDQLAGTSPRSNLDGWVRGSLALARSRLQIGLGDLRRAEEELSVDLDANQARASLSEHEAMRGLISAARNMPAQAEERLANALDRSCGIEPFALATVTRAILATNRNRPADAAKAFQEILSTGHRDAIVMACRASPALAKSLGSNDNHRSTLAAIFSESADVALAKASGVPIS
jgi:tetratricopeptide (TPR) repeat protein